MSQAKRVADELRDFHLKHVRKVALFVDRGVVLNTPVDTGRAMGNWLVGLGGALRGARSKLDKVGTSTINEGSARISRVKLGQPIFISNNLPYIGELEDGSSEKASSGMVRITINEAKRVFGGS